MQGLLRSVAHEGTSAHNRAVSVARLKGQQLFAAPCCSSVVCQSSSECGSIDGAQFILLYHTCCSYHRCYSQGSWTKCLDCMRETGTDTTSKTTQTNQPEAFACKRCVERDWRQKLLPNGHACSACRNVFDASCWDAQLIKKHRHSDRGLVCPGCTERGYAPSKYEEHHCEECREEYLRTAAYNPARIFLCFYVCLHDTLLIFA